MRVAIIGAGLAGLAVCWHLSRSLGIQTVLFDSRGIGGGASGVSTGLLHPFAGSQALRSWGSHEGMAATESLLNVAEEAIGGRVAEKTGIFRPAITKEQKRDFIQSEASWIEHPEFGEGLWIPEGITVYSRRYLQGLWQSCASSNATFIQETISSLDALSEFDQVVLTTGFETLQFDLCRHFHLNLTKGQMLVCRWQERLPHSLVSQGHITPTEDPSLCQIGSTYERQYSHLDPDPQIACELKEKIAKFYPPARDLEVVEVRSGVRISRPHGYRPLIEKVDAKTWVFTGLGSRGLLYHAWLGSKLSQAIVSRDHRFPSNCQHLSQCNRTASKK